MYMIYIQTTYRTLYNLIGIQLIQYKWENIELTLVKRRYTESSSTSLVIKKMEIKTTMKCYYTHTIEWLTITDNTMDW